MDEITLESFEDTIKELITANAHARNKGDKLKKWIKEKFGCDACIAFIKSQQQLTNRVSEQFRYFAPVVVFVCLDDVKRDRLIDYILERSYDQLDAVAIIGAKKIGDDAETDNAELEVNSDTEAEIIESESDQVTDDDDEIIEGEYEYKYEHLIVFRDSSFEEWASTIFEDVRSEKKYAWYVDSHFKNKDGEFVDNSEEYITQGYWCDDNIHNIEEIAEKIKIGDRIALKSVDTQDIDLPFDNNGKKVSCMHIKAIGVIKENKLLDEGRLIVEWSRLESEKIWYGPGTVKHNIKVMDGDVSDIARWLFLFSFRDAPQDYLLCEEFYAETHEGEKLSCLDIKRKPVEDKVHPFNFIVYGAPGTGKTYSMVEYALAVIDNLKLEDFKIQNPSREDNLIRYKKLVKEQRIVFTTFHQNYGYEEFIQGLRPDTNSETMKFTTVDGVFKSIADKALRHKNEERFVIIIDEINRANISKVFGELITLIEEDKRWGERNELNATLQSGEPFAVPNNLYIIGTMNSADKSISLIDAALRRRFAFFEEKPKALLVNDDILRAVLETTNLYLADKLESTDLLVGHSYFMNKGANDLCDIMNNNIIPLVYEYSYDQRNRVYGWLEHVKEKTGAPFEIVDDKIGRLKVKKKEEGTVDGDEQV